MLHYYMLGTSDATINDHQPGSRALGSFELNADSPPTNVTILFLQGDQTTIQLSTITENTYHIISFQILYPYNGVIYQSIIISSFCRC